MSEKIEKAPAILLLATGIKLVEDGKKVKKKEKKIRLDETKVKKPSPDKCIPKYFSRTTFEKKSEEFRRYLRMNTETYQVQILIYLFLYLFIYLSQKLSRKIFLQ